MGNSCPDHTKIIIRVQPWRCWGVCWEIDVGPLLFTLLRLEMTMCGVWTDQCDQPLVPWSRTNFSSASSRENVGDDVEKTMLARHVWHYYTPHPEMSTDGVLTSWCDQFHIWGPHRLVHLGPSRPNWCGAHANGWSTKIHANLWNKAWCILHPSNFVKKKV